MPASVYRMYARGLVRVRPVGFGRRLGSQGASGSVWFFFACLKMGIRVKCAKVPHGVRACGGREDGVAHAHRVRHACARLHCRRRRLCRLCGGRAPRPARASADLITRTLWLVWGGRLHLIDGRAARARAPSTSAARRLHTRRSTRALRQACLQLRERLSLPYCHILTRVPGSLAHTFAPTHGLEDPGGSLSVTCRRGHPALDPSSSSLPRTSLRKPALTTRYVSVASLPPRRPCPCVEPRACVRRPTLAAPLRRGGSGS